MSSINDLPTELLDRILKLVENPLAQLSVCRKFKDVATPIAYRHIQLKNAAYPLPLLLHTIINQPFLGSHTQFLCFGFPSWSFPKHTLVEQYRDEFSNFATDAAARGLPQEVQLELKKGSIEAMLALLLSYFPALHSLHIDRAIDMNSIFTPYISPTTQTYSGLQSLRLLIIDHARLYGNDCIAPLLRLPALRTFSCFGTFFEYTVSDSELPPGSSSLEQICLEYCELDDGTLATMIRSSQALRRLRYRSHWSDILGSFYMSSTWNALLECAKHTLESLDLVLIDKDPVGPVGSPGLLRDFTRLTHVYATLTILIGPPGDDDPTPLSMVLPQSLVFLAVWIDDHWWARGIYEVVQLLASKCDYFGQLKELRVRSGADADLEIIQSLCLAEGVKFGEFETAFSMDETAELEDEGPCFHEIHS